MRLALASSNQILAPEHIAILAVVIVGLAIFGLVRRRRRQSEQRK